MKPSIILKTMSQASLGLRQKSLFLHLEAYSNCQSLFAFRFRRISWCLASLSSSRVASDGCFDDVLKAVFLFSMAFSRASSESVNQSGRFLVSEAVSSKAAW